MDLNFDKLDKIENNNYSVDNECTSLQSRLTARENYDSNRRQGFSNVRNANLFFLLILDDNKQDQKDL